MKRSERHHLKENELAHMTAAARQAVESRGRQVGAVLLALVVVGGALVGYFYWQSRQENRAGRMLAEAMAVGDTRVGPPASPDSTSTSKSFATEREKHEAALAKFKAVADEYSSTDAGQFARYQQASLLMSLGKASEAAATYQLVIDRAAGVYSQMAKLGLAEAQANVGQYDQAIASYKSLTEQKEQSSVPLDGLLVQLGRTYLAAGKASEAQQTFERVVKEFPLSPFSSEAQRQLDKLKKSVA